MIRNAMPLKDMMPQNVQKIAIKQQLGTLQKTARAKVASLNVVSGKNIPFFSPNPRSNNYQKLLQEIMCLNKYNQNSHRYKIIY